MDSLSIRAKCGGEATGPNPVDRAKLGSKIHLLVDKQGVPLAVLLSCQCSPLIARGVFTGICHLQVVSVDR